MIHRGFPAGTSGNDPTCQSGDIGHRDPVPGGEDPLEEVTATPAVEGGVFTAGLPRKSQRLILALLPAVLEQGFTAEGQEKSGGEEGRGSTGSNCLKWRK